MFSIIDKAVTNFLHFSTKVEKLTDLGKVGELLNINNYFGQRTNITTDEELDAALLQGTYRITAGAELTDLTIDGSLKVFALGSASITQEYSSYDASVRKRRTKWYDIQWTPWESF